MTEKRFTLIDMNNIEWELISPIKDNCGDLTVKQVLDVLNELHEENEQLKKALWEAEESYIYERYEYSFEIEEELEELKKRFERRYWQEEDEL